MSQLDLPLASKIWITFVNCTVLYIFNYTNYVILEVMSYSVVSSFVKDMITYNLIQYSTYNSSLRNELQI